MTLSSLSLTGVLQAKFNRFPFQNGGIYQIMVRDGAKHVSVNKSSKMMQEPWRIIKYLATLFVGRQRGANSCGGSILPIEGKCYFPMYSGWSEKRRQHEVTSDEWYDALQVSRFCRHISCLPPESIPKLNSLWLRYKISWITGIPLFSGGAKIFHFCSW